MGNLEYSAEVPENYSTCTYSKIVSTCLIFIFIHLPANTPEVLIKHWLLTYGPKQISINPVSAKCENQVHHLLITGSCKSLLGKISLISVYLTVHMPLKLHWTLGIIMNLQFDRWFNSQNTFVLTIATAQNFILKTEGNIMKCRSELKLD